MRVAWTLEDQLILACCRQDVVSAEMGECVEWLPRIDWQFFIERAKKEGVAGLVFQQLSQTDWLAEGVPEWVADALGTDYYTTATRNTLLFEELGRILAGFEQRGLEVLVLKGAVLAEKAYKNLALRSMSDIDLLIHRQDFSVFDNFMQEQGYSSQALGALDPDALPVHYLTTVMYTSAARSSLCLHVHWHFVNSTLPNHKLTENISMKSIWRDAEKTMLAGAPAKVMAPHHLLIHLAEHSLRVTHSLGKLSYLTDMGAVISAYEGRIDWQKVSEESRNFQIAELVYFPLFYAKELVGAPVPEKLLADLGPAKRGILQKVFISFVKKNRRFPGLSYLLHFSQVRGIMAKIIFVFRTFVPPRQVLAQRYGIRSDDVTLLNYVQRFWEVFYATARILGRDKK